MKTQREYYFSESSSATANVIQIKACDVGAYIVLDRTIFVPQGGGQPADGGTIAGVHVKTVQVSEESPEIIVHTVADPTGLKEGTEVELRIDRARRAINSLLHTGGHLIAALGEELLPNAKASRGHHWPGEAR